jgi:glycosyltransferase involved in cell wall biosynthesis
MSPVRLAVVCDYPEEQWPSMDLVGEMILTYLRKEHVGEVAAIRICPPFHPRFTHASWRGVAATARNSDRLLNRLVDYPRALRAIVRLGGFDLYHLVDHSYSQLVHVLPPGRAVVTCHDLDTFRCLLEPSREPRSRWFRAMARHVLSGLCKAAAIVCDSEATRDGFHTHDLVPDHRLHVIPLGISPEFTPEPMPEADADAARLIGPPDPTAPPDLLHVGSAIPRKRIDVLLCTLAGVRRVYPGARLIKVGGSLTADQARLAHDLGIADAIVGLPFVDRATLAAVYRRAALVLLPSEAEGFGLPLAEALACGVPLLASDISVLREVGGTAVVHAPVGDVPAWTEAALGLLDDRRRVDLWHARRAAGFAQARQFHWSTHVRQLTALYRSLLSDQLTIR